METYEPKVEVTVDAERVRMRPSRPTVGRFEVSVPRSSDLLMDLTDALRRLVLITS